MLLLGLKSSGKTWLLAKVRMHPADAQLREMYLGGPTPTARIAPTIGQNVLDVNWHGVILHMWDLGGASSMRELWLEYVPDAHVLAWSVDAHAWHCNEPVPDEGGTRYREASCNALVSVVREAAAHGLEIVVLVCKLDVQDATPVADVEDHILAHWATVTDASTATLRPTWHFCGVSSATGDGLAAAVDQFYTCAVQQ